MRVFIAYSRDSESHVEWVEELARALRREGVPVELPEESDVAGEPSEGNLRRAIHRSRFVLLVGSPGYLRERESGETRLLDELLRADCERPHRRVFYVPVLASGTRAEAIPPWFKGGYVLDLRDWIPGERLHPGFASLVERLRPQSSPDPPAFAEVRLVRLSVGNLRCFRDEQTLDLTAADGTPARWTVLLGDNASGKTTLLQAIVLAIESWGDGPARDRATFRPRDGTRAASVAAELATPDGNVTVALTFHHDWQECSAPSIVGHSLPAVFAYGAARKLSPSTLKPTEAADPTATLLAPEADLLNAEEWLLRLDYAARTGGPEGEYWKARLEQVRRVLVALLPEVEDVHVSGPRGSQGLKLGNGSPGGRAYASSPRAPSVRWSPRRLTLRPSPPWRAPSLRLADSCSARRI